MVLDSRRWEKIGSYRPIIAIFGIADKKEQQFETDLRRGGGELLLRREIVMYVIRIERQISVIVIWFVFSHFEAKNVEVRSEVVAYILLFSNPFFTSALINSSQIATLFKRRFYFFSSS